MRTNESTIVEAALAASLGVISGVLVGLAGRADGLGALCVVGWIPVLVALRRSGPWPAAVAGAATGAVSLLVAMAWMPETISRILPSGGWVPTVAWWATVGAFGLAMACWGALSSVSARIDGPARWAVPALGLAVVESFVPFAVPVQYGAAAWKMPVLLQVAEIGGGAAVTSLVLLVNLSILGVIDRVRGVPAPFVLWSVTAATLLVSTVRMAHVRTMLGGADTIRVAVLEPHDGFQGREASAITADRRARRLLESTRSAARAGADLVIWPETAWPYAFDRDRDRDFPAGHPWRVVPSGDPTTAVVAGSLTVSSTGDTFNSAVAFEADGRITGVYDKRVPFPLGETSLLDDVLERLRLGRSDLAADLPLVTAGDGPRTLDVADVRVAPLICNEEFQLTGLTNAELREVDLLVGMSSDVWFGGPAASSQHLAQAVLRAIETRRHVVRASMPSGSAVIDPTGRVAWSMPASTAVGGVAVGAANIATTRTASIAPAIAPAFRWLALVWIIALLFAGRPVSISVGTAEARRPRSAFS
ncbi:MAG: apolipoprotein N-acyltransferase [Planctomycetota bacterium]